MVNSPLIRPCYFMGVPYMGGRLTGHDGSCHSFFVSGNPGLVPLKLLGGSVSQPTPQ